MATRSNSSAPRRTWRRFVRWTAAILLLLVVSAIGLIHTSPVQQFVLRRIEGIARAAGYPFTATRVQFRLFDLEFSLSGFVYDNRGIRVEADSLVVDVPWDIYRREGIALNSLLLDGLRIVITSPEPVLPEPSGDTTRIPRIAVGRLEVRNARLTYTNASTRVDVPAFELEARNGRGTLKFAAPITVSPDTTVQIPEMPLNLGPENIVFGPTRWSVDYAQRHAAGSAGGALRWAPSVGLSLNFSTEPLTIAQWDRISAQGVIRYEDGILNIEGFRATRGEGDLTGSAKVTDKSKSATIVWNRVSLNPSGVRGVTRGQVDLQWNASDFSDVRGTGRVSVATPEYGNANGVVRINGRQARFDIRGLSRGADIRATLTTGLDRRLAGTFQLTHNKYGSLTAQGRLRGTLTSPLVDARVVAGGMNDNGVGPVSGSASIAYRQNVLDVTEIMAHLRQSAIPDGQLRINLKSRSVEGAIPSIVARVEDFVANGFGEVQASAVISGSLEHPAATFTASSRGLDIGGTHIDSVQADAALADDVLRVTRLNARQKEGSLDASGIVDLSTEQVQGQAKISNLQITEVRNLSAIVNMDADISGTVREPSATLKGEVTDLEYEGQEHGSLLVNAAVNRQTAELRLKSAKYKADVDTTVSMKEPYAFTATVEANQSPIDQMDYVFVADGRVSADGSLKPVTVDSLQFNDFTLTGEGVDLKAHGALSSGVAVELMAELAKLPVENVSLAGTAQVSAVVRGPIDNPQVDGDLHTTNASVQTATMAEPASVEAAVTFTRDRFVIREMHAEYADARAAITGDGTLKGTGEFTFVAENIRPERFLMDRPLTGLIGVQGRLKLSAPRVDAIEGQATVTQFELNARGIEVRQTQQGEVLVENQIASIRNFTLEGPETKASAGGTVNLASGDINLDVKAATDLRILEGFVPRSTAFGRIESEVAVRGNTNEPDMRGFVNIDDAQIQIDDPSVLLSEVSARVGLAGSRIQIEKATGNLNGGAFELTGAAGISSEGLRDAAIQVQLSDTTLEYPEGLQTGVAADLTLKGSSPNLTLAGQVRVLDAIYREDISLGEQIFERLTPDSEDEVAYMPMLGAAGDINLDVAVETTGPVTVANNLARMDLFGTFRVRGTVSEPVVVGRAEALEGGEVYFGPSSGGEATALRERRDRYIIERGIVEFNNPVRTEPTIDLEATHDLQVKDERYAIRLTAMGTLTDLRTELTSDPFLTERDIVTMLLTGRTFSDLQSSQMAVAGVPLDYLSGQLTSRFFQTAGTALGLDTVTIEPVTGGAEDDLSARLTVAKDLRKDLSVIYAQNLAGPRNQSWIVNYSTVKNFVVRGISRPDEDEIRMELRHGLDFGGGPPLPRRISPHSEPELKQVTFSKTTLAEAELSKHVAKVGSPYSVNRMSEDVRSLQEFFATEGYVDAKIRTTREAVSDGVNVHFTIEQGPKAGFEYHSTLEKVPESVQKEVRQIFVDSRAEAPAIRQGVSLLQRYFRDKGYLESLVSSSATSPNADERTYVFLIEEGPRFKDPKWVFEGTEPLNITDSAGAVMADMEGIQQQIESRLRARGFLDAKATLPVLIKEPEPRFLVSVNPGPQYMVSAINYEGNAFFADSHLTNVVVLGPTPVIPPDEPGALRPPEAEKELKPFPYTSDWVSTARRRIMSEYWQQGFNEVQIGASTDYIPHSGKIKIDFDIKEGERQIIHSVRIMGDEKTLYSHLKRYLRIADGDPVDFSRISLTRKRLYDTGLFKRVDIQILKEPEGNVAEIDLNERAPWSLRYGFSVTDHRENQVRDRDVGVSTELTYRNLFGRGVVAGFTGKVDRTFREARVFTAFPVFLNRDVASTLSLFRTREAIPDVVTNTWGFTLKQQWRMRDYYLFSYDYSYRRVSSFEVDLGEDNPDLVSGVIPVARFNVTLSRDTRDDIFNATRGTFLSNSFDFAPPGIGSAVKYIRNYTQYLKFKEVRPNLVWASAYRFGAARGLGGTNVVPSDQFTAGGATGLRAFSQDNSALTTGNALFITNQELRFPLFWRFSGVGFFDIGNAYERIGTTNLTRQRYSPGIGVRIETPFILLRVDLGLNLWPRTGEDKRRISFGIGQAF
ncbi:MAG TPA: translocation/assembly module TamB domain-containing protein [Terriglobia bacterium]|nr:translocation/assembly module TamB domain-containing protein [Terriglobia bacterium]